MSRFHIKFRGRMFLSVRRFHVGLHVSLIAGPSGGSNLQAHHLQIHIYVPLEFCLDFSFCRC